MASCGDWRCTLLTATFMQQQETTTVFGSGVYRSGLCSRRPALMGPVVPLVGRPMAGEIITSKICKALTW